MSVDIGDGEVILDCNEFAVLKRQSYSRLSGSRPDIFYGEGSVLNLNYYLSNSFACSPPLSLLKRMRTLRLPSQK